MKRDRQGEEGMKQVEVTPAAVAQWQEDTTARIAAGWTPATIRGQLAGSGCPPELIEEILRKAQEGVAPKGERRTGRTVVVAGIVIVLAGIAIALKSLWA